MRKNKSGLVLLLSTVIGIGAGCSQTNNRQLIYSGEIELYPGHKVDVECWKVSGNLRKIKKRNIELIGTESGELREVILGDKKIYDSKDEQTGIIEKASCIVPPVFLPISGTAQIINSIFGDKPLNYGGEGGVLGWKLKYEKHLNAVNNAIYNQNKKAE